MVRLLQVTKQVLENKEGGNSKVDTMTCVVTYARVSGSKQRQDLVRQQERLKEVVKVQNWKLVKQYQDIGSGLNDNRQGLIRLIKELLIIQPAMIVCSYQDRLARFRLKLLQTICAGFNTKIVVTNAHKQIKTLEEQLVKDVLAILTSFAGKLHRARRGK